MLKKGENGIKYRPIGDVFEFDGEILRVERCESEDEPCAGCFFENIVPCYRYSEKGTCVEESRPDHKDVIFKEVGREVAC